jgi:hypothetical protein
VHLTITVELGNDAMATYADVRRILARTAETMKAAGRTEPGDGDGGSERDENGNTVLRWEVSA